MILHLLIKFYLNGTTCIEVMTSYRFFKDAGQSVGNLLPASVLVTAFV